MVKYLAIYSTHTANGDSPLYTNTKHAGNKSRLDFLIKDRENSHTRGFTPHRTKQTESSNRTDKYKVSQLIHEAMFKMYA